MFEKKCVAIYSASPRQGSDRTHQCLKLDISDSKSPSNLSIKCQSHFCVSLICREYAFQLHIVARDTYVSKMCSSWVIIEMVIGKMLKKKKKKTTLFSFA